jgi:Protein of unknown function (DUF1573)
MIIKQFFNSQNQTVTMKRTLFFGVLLVAGLISMLAVGRQLTAVFGWETTTHNFGKIAKGQPVTATFAFTNKGQGPLIISNAKGSCGCTNVTFTRDAILPGQSGSVSATYNAAAVGAFNKTVMVESNAEGGAFTLSFQGEVE